MNTVPLRPVISRVWCSVPPSLRGAVESVAGPVRAAAETGWGRRAGLRLALDVPGGRVFLKAMPRAHRHAGTLDSEACVAGAVAALAPRLLHEGSAGGWRWLLFEHVPGRTCDLSAGSADRDAAARAVRHLAALPAPPGVRLRAQTRWAHLGAGLDLGLLAGDRLVHTDLNGGNILIQAGGRAVLVDWARPAQGAGWLSSGFLLAHIIDGGTRPAKAESWARRALPAWAGAAPEATDTFVSVLARRRAEQAATCALSRRAEREGQLRSAQAWQHHRLHT
ncbi:hypothetical protein ABT160_28590 [Streptomyces sp. NPDC001941]|uniref:hypothetical protein n=1 Tax=Streptomyces sp. NPDC001941 TaxID=3154659 RepID=UPI00331E95B4